MKCPCKSNQEFSECCEPYLKGTAKPMTAEKLMRSRYSAYVETDIEYIKKTIAPESRTDFDMKSTREWAQKADWKGLQILSTDKGTAEDKKGTVEFVATYDYNGEGLDHHEVAQFRKGDDGQWLFVDGESHTHRAGETHQHHHAKVETVVREAPKVGRNDPCTCGSGKKYKKCCGADASA
ncbi:MAG: YchJ family protein [Bdellovibrio sp.]|nr:YchJ family protein [Bdellovibrio sp.]